MTKTTTGWLVFIAALGMMCGLLSQDVSKLGQWGEAIKPSFVAVIMAHLSVVIMAFIGGKLIPEPRESGIKTRSTDVTTDSRDQ
jgi:hypothetical protein